MVGMPGDGQAYNTLLKHRCAPLLSPQVRGAVFLVRLPLKDRRPGCATCNGTLSGLPQLFGDVVCMQSVGALAILDLLQVREI